MRYGLSCSKLWIRYCEDIPLLVRQWGNLQCGFGLSWLIHHCNIEWTSGESVSGVADCGGGFLLEGGPESVFEI